MKAFYQERNVSWISAIVACASIYCLAAVAPKPLAVPQIKDLIQPWIFVRASEASTLFIDETLKGREPYGHLIVLDESRYQWLEFDGVSTALWNVTCIERDERQMTVHLQSIVANPEAKPSRLVVYPYWDIDDCLVMIRFDPGAEENPVRFSTPYSFKGNLPYLAADE